MGIDFFKLKNKENKFLVLDIGTEAVKGLICKKENSKITIFEAGIQYFERYGVFNGRDFETEVIKRAILKTLKQGWEKLPVLVTLSPNILKARVVQQSFERKSPKKRIFKKEQELIYQQVFEKAKKEISQRFVEKFGILARDIQWINQEVLEIKIDGYSVSVLQGYEGKYLDLKILETFLLKYYFESIKRIFEDLQLKVLKITHLAESLLNAFKERDGIFLDIGGEVSQIFLIKQGNLKQVNELKKGGKIFSQELSETLGIDEASARDLKQRYASKLLSPETEKRIKTILSEEKRTWCENLKQSLPKELFPSAVFLFGGGSLLPEIREVLKENGIEVKFIYPKDLKEIKDETKSLNSPQYIPSLLTCYYA